MSSPCMPNDDHADAIELGRVPDAVQDDHQQAGIRPPYIGNVLRAGQIMAAAIGLDVDGGGGDTDQHAVELRVDQEGDIQDDNGIGDGGNAGQGMAGPQHGLPAAIGNGDDARRSRRLCKLLFFLVVEVLRLAALYYVKTVIFEDSLSVRDVPQPCVGIVLVVASIAIECLRLGGVVNNTEADLLFIRSKRVMRFAQLLLSLLGVLR